MTSELDENIAEFSAPKTIECVNFNMDETTISFTKLFEEMVFSPGFRFAVNIKTDEKRVTSMFVLDPFNMQFHQYRNLSEEDLKMDFFYWYNEDCLVFIYADKKTLYQIPVLLNHQEKTYETRQAVIYTTPSFIYFEETFLIAQCIESMGRKYVLLPCNPDAFRLMYAVSHEPDASIQLKRFMFENTLRVDRLESKIIARIRAERGENIRFFLSSQITVINNHATAPIRFHCENEDEVFELLGHFILAHFDEISELPPSVKQGDRRRITRYVVSLVNDGHHTSWDCDKLDAPLEHYIRRPGRYITVDDNLVFVSEEEISGRKISRVSYIEVTDQTTLTIHEETHSEDSEVAVCLTPFNILIAKKISPSQISTSIVPYVFNGLCETFPTLQGMALSKTYLNWDSNPKFPHTFTI